MGFLEDNLSVVQSYWLPNPISDRGKLEVLQSDKSDSELESLSFDCSIKSYNFYSPGQF